MASRGPVCVVSAGDRVCVVSRMTISPLFPSPCLTFWHEIDLPWIRSWEAPREVSSGTHRRHMAQHAFLLSEIREFGGTAGLDSSTGQLRRLQQFKRQRDAGCIQRALVRWLTNAPRECTVCGDSLYFYSMTSITRSRCHRACQDCVTGYCDVSCEEG